MTLVHKYINGTTAVKIAGSIEAAVRDDRIAGGEKLPTVRFLADHLGVSPATVAAAYQTLQARGLVFSQGRRGTRVSHRPVVSVAHRPAAPSGAVDLSDGNPDRELLPDMARALGKIDPAPCLYGDGTRDPDLARFVCQRLVEEGATCGQICVVNGAMDGLERILAEHLRPGDRVAVEDPGFSGILDLLMSRGLHLEPVPVDAEGMLPDDLGRACAARVQAVIVTPRAHNPTGAALSTTRARDLRRVLKRHPDILVVEDDHMPLISGAALEVLHRDRRQRWAYVRSYCKALNPDLRLAIITGDDDTMQRVQDRLIVGERWVSHILQRTAYALLSDDGVQKFLHRSGQTYAQRRNALLRALAAQGLLVEAPSGYNVWIPVPEETPTVQALLSAGWAVTAGERFRIHAAPAIRITAAKLQIEQAEALAAALRGILRRPARAAV